MPSNTGSWSLKLLSGQLRFCPTAAYSCLQCPQLPELVSSVLWEFHCPFIHFKDTACLVEIFWLNLQLVQLIGKLNPLPSHSAPGVQLWFYLHSTCGLSSGVCSEAALEDWVPLQGGPGVEVVQLLGSQVLWQLQVCRGAGGQESRRHGSLCFSLWQLCSSGDLLWQWCGSLEHRASNSARYPGGARGHWYRRYGATRIFSSLWHSCLTINSRMEVQLLGLQGTLAVPSVQGPWQTQEQELWHL